ncbi:MAG: pyridoxamine 5'-phosphate oxidase family protein [Alphaproteobacteria bacterium]|nr:pyridoxamine 5'-phosphate oxidase family protein [Alphaproteobacteria bacterium]
MAEDHVARAWELMERIRTCMLVTWDGQAQRARPMSAIVKREEHAVYFLTDVRQPFVDQLQRYPTITLAFADIGAEKYVTASGRGAVSDDRAKIKELWSPYSKAWFDSSDDPNIRVLTFSPEEAELWDMPGRFMTSVKMLAAAATNTRPNLGDTAKVEL